MDAHPVSTVIVRTWVAVVAFNRRADASAGNTSIALSAWVVVGALCAVRQRLYVALVCFFVAEADETMNIGNRAVYRRTRNALPFLAGFLTVAE